MGRPSISINSKIQEVRLKNTEIEGRVNLLLRDFLITLHRFFLSLKFISLKFFADKDQIEKS